jgi:L-rhamnose isomerase
MTSPVSKTRRKPDGGIQATGNYPGKARNATELRADLSRR